MYKSMPSLNLCSLKEFFGETFLLFWHKNCFIPSFRLFTKKVFIITLDFLTLNKKAGGGKLLRAGMLCLFVCLFELFSNYNEFNGLQPRKQQPVKITIISGHSRHALNLFTKLVEMLVEKCNFSETF